MAHKLADELLSMILSPYLIIPDHQFISADTTSFGCNDNISSSTVLVVCKRWMRIATPLLYETIVIRSPGQAHSLADAFKKNPEFGLHVRKIRLEGAYSRLFEVFKRCTKLHSIFFTLLEVISADCVTALCRSLPIISPTRVIFVDVDTTGHVGDNSKKRKLFDSLCESIPKWTKLEEFHFPYDITPWNPFLIGNMHTRRNRLANVLACSPTLRQIHSETPQGWDTPWFRLSSNSQIQFYFDHEPKADSRYYAGFLNTIANRPDLKRIVHFESRAEPLERSIDTVDDPFFSPLASMESGVAEKIWDRVFAFTLLDHPDDVDLSDVLQDVENLTDLVQTRNTLSLVCKQWHGFVQRFFLSAPLITSPEALISLANLISHDPTIGLQVQTFILEPMGWFSEELSSVVCHLLPYFGRLRHFIGGHGCTISFSAFEAFSQAAGDTLEMIVQLIVEDCGPVASPVFRHFRCLQVLDICSFPRVIRGEDPTIVDCLSSVYYLRIDNLAPCATLFSTLRFFSLQRVAFANATSLEFEFLEKCGGRILDLEVKMYGDSGSSDDCRVDLLANCYNLTTLRIGSNRFYCPKFLEHASGNETLERIFVSSMVEYCDRTGNQKIDRFFAGLKLSKFPSLNTLGFLEYEWPVHHRKIARDRLVKMALEMKETSGLIITDQSGKPFRPRVQRRTR